MKKLIAIILILCLSFSVVFAADSSSKNTEQAKFDYVPYEDKEFPVWSQKLRRGEILFFGSMALSFPLVVLSYNLAVNKFGATPIEDSNKKVLIQLGAAAGIALTISLTDFIIGEVNGE